jgi:hypothetical protein
MPALDEQQLSSNEAHFPAKGFDLLAKTLLTFLWVVVRADIRLTRRTARLYRVYGLSFTLGVGKSCLGGVNMNKGICPHFAADNGGNLLVEVFYG